MSMNLNGKLKQTSKFQILSISKYKPVEIIINNIKLNYNNKITILGLKIGHCGISLHIKERVYSVGATLMRLKRF